MENNGNGGDFLPTNYEVPAGSGGYMKLQDGENRFRIMDRPIIGYEYWNTDKKPIRSKEQWAVIPKDIQIGLDGKPGLVKHFWAMVVWNYAEEEIQILELTQKQILSSIQTLAKDPDWGTPLGYDLKINKKGKGLDTEYSVVAIPHKIVSDEIQEAYLAKCPIRLNALYEGGNPFDKTATPNDNDPLPF
jgi:hypothetical protein